MVYMGDGIDGWNDAHGIGGGRLDRRRFFGVGGAAVLLCTIDGKQVAVRTADAATAALGGQEAG